MQKQKTLQQSFSLQGKGLYQCLPWKGFWSCGQSHSLTSLRSSWHRYGTFQGIV